MVSLFLLHKKKEMQVKIVMDIDQNNFTIRVEELLKDGFIIEGYSTSHSKEVMVHSAVMVKYEGPIGIFMKAANKKTIQVQN